jgi:hypothetical protein
MDELGIRIDSDDPFVLLGSLLAQKHFQRTFPQTNLAHQADPDDFLLPLDYANFSEKGLLRIQGREGILRIQFGVFG